MQFLHYNKIMRVILTHEQADFDALASLLAAHLLDAAAIPVLPRRINRNARAFVEAYAGDLPFMDARRLPAEPIDMVTLVDTQSLVTLKGIGERTKINVVDHHARRTDLPASWQVEIDTSGACASLLVEHLVETSTQLTERQASLLLLGIYEDTGSLTYSHTSPRDLRAAAFLIEQGASRALLADYLNPPLSPEQRQLYDNLVKTVESYQIHDQTIIVAHTAALQLTDEISSVAHKLRDLFDPDAIFLLVHTGEGVRLVARSTTDQVNVAAVARALGGGGHSRAAAALIHVPDGAENAAALARAHQELLGLLPQYVRPAVTVGQIMSRHPHLLSPQTSAREAALMMQRSGYEGYPVVEEGRVVGLLTRRAVDRAVTHQIDLPAASLMNAGSYSVSPSVSLDELQVVMRTSGWGQVPVLDPHSGQVVGIVTRTDVLKHLAPQTLRAEAINLATELEAALSPTRLALLKAVAAIGLVQKTAVYIVGGFVRDLILKRPSLDFDIVLEGDAIALAEALTARYGGRVVIHRPFRTAKWHIAGVREAVATALGDGVVVEAEDLPESLDLISARSEFYDRPGALPIIERGGIKLDLHRRDFTINTLALRLDGIHYSELHDNWGGLGDLNRGLVRVLHSLSFIDDPTRMLRAVRFEQRFHFQIEKRTVELLSEALPMLKQISGERLHHELDLILLEEQALAMMARLDQLGILKAIHPDLTWEDNLSEDVARAQRLTDATEWDLPASLGGLPVNVALAYLVWLVRLPVERAANVCSRLTLSGALTGALLAACHLRQTCAGLVGLTPSQVTLRLDGQLGLVLYVVDQVLDEPAIHAILWRYMSRWRKIHPVTTGKDLRRRGLAPSPFYRKILSALRTAWLDGQVNSLDEEEVLLEKLLEEHQGHGVD
jgi:tRNA nucleotidyltransferase (CCA-adding enzyme)